MKRGTRIRIPAALLVITAAMCISHVARSDMIAAGKAAFRTHCAVCHGLEAKGDGPMAEVFDPRPPNLTLLGRANDGFFPYGEVFDMIDGRREVLAHGTRDMPIWGEAFMPKGIARGTEVELQVYGRILALTRYLQILQVE